MIGFALFCFSFRLNFRVAAKKHQQDHVLARAVQSHPNRVPLIIRKMAAKPSITRHCMKQLGKCHFFFFVWSLHRMQMYWHWDYPSRLDNEKLKNQLKKKDDDLMNARGAIDRFTNAVSIEWLSFLYIEQLFEFLFTHLNVFLFKN